MTGKNKTKKIFLSLSILLLVFFAVGAKPQPAHAILGLGDLSITIGDIPATIRDIFDRIRSKAGAIAFQQAVRNVTYRLAQDTAVWIASGDRGRKPLIFEEPGKALRDIGDRVAGSFLENVSKGLPINVCNPGSLRVLKQITIGVDKSISDIGFDFGGDYKEQCRKGQNADLICARADDLSLECQNSGGQGEACQLAAEAGFECAQAQEALINCARRSGQSSATGCKASDIKNNFARAIERDDFLQDVGITFQSGQNELSIFGLLKEKAEEEKRLEEQSLVLEASKGGDTKPVTDPVTGDIITPREQVANQQKIAQEQSAGISDYITGDLFVDTASVFVTNLTNAYLRRLQRGFYPFRNNSGGPDSELTIFGTIGSRKALLASFDEFSQTRALKVTSPGKVDLFTEMSTCPPSQYQTPYNCLLNEGLQSAVQQEVTLKQAVNQGLIDANLQFPQNHSPEIANLSMANLKKLRFLRVIPVGWEIAAEKINSNTSNTKISFGDLLNCFEDEVAENQYRNWFNNVYVPWFEAPVGQRGNEPIPPITIEQLRKLPAGCPRVDSSDPASDNLLYHLVDPGWVLSLPEQFCRAQGYGGIPEHEQSPNRQNVCVDLQSCVNYDTNGNCVSYGYCTREKSSWQLSGKQCEKQYASCRTFTGLEGNKRISVLTNYLDDEGCDAGNAGCQWYSTAKNLSEDVDNLADDWNTDERIYLTAQSQSCLAQDAGSAEIIPLTSGINLIRNGDFDPVLSGAQPNPSEGGWFFDPGLDITFNELGSINSVISIGSFQDINIKPFTYYTLSFDVQSLDYNQSGSSIASVSVQSSTPLKNVSFNSDILDTESGNLTLNLSVDNGDINADDFTRYGATFYSKNATTVRVSLLGGDIYDNVQLEEVSLSDGLAAVSQVRANQGSGVDVLNRIVSGSIRTTSPATSFKTYRNSERLVFSQAELCSAEEVSAHRYTPNQSSQSSRVARVLPGGLCPQSCVGLNEFLQVPSSLELLDNPNALPERISFIPNLAQSCSAQQVGCEEFTNLSLEGTAQERREYYSKIESCVLDSNQNSQTFYTWEGTDSNGFQLRSWQLLADSDGGPCANYPQGSGLNPSTGSCQGVSECAVSSNNPNCRIFINEAGEEKFRDVTKVVTASAQCTGFRRTTDQQEWYFIPGEANKCSAQAVQCREYKGKDANIVRRLVFSSFENGNIDNWQTSGFESGLSSESIVAGQSSMRIATGESASKTINLSDFSVTGSESLADAKSANLKFLAKCDGLSCQINNLHIATQGGNILPVSSQPVFLSDNWRQYEIGPALLNSSFSGSEVLSFANSGSNAIFIDNIELILNEDRFFFKANTVKSTDQGGNQPNECLAPVANFNTCTQYTDESSNTFYISRFDKLFSEKSLDCTAVIDTQNSNSPYSQVFNRDELIDNPLDNYTVPADTLNYRYIKRENLRPASVAGCSEVGLPSDVENPSSWQTAYKIIDPDSFATTLCRDEALGCTEFIGSDGARYVFRDPGNKLCAWDPGTNQFVKKDSQGGFILDANNDPVNCADENLVFGGDGWVAECPAAQNSCTTYQPTNPSFGGDHFYYKLQNPNFEEPDQSIHYLSNTIKSGNCEGGEDVDIGCVNFEVDPQNLDKFIQDPPPQVVFEVETTRQCAEWLSPITSSDVNDSQSRSQRTVNHDLGRCQLLDSDGKCISWSGCAELGPGGVCNELSPNFPKVYDNPDAGTPFDRTGFETYVGTFNPNEYANRLAGGQTMFGTGWDYSGYTVPNQPPIEFLNELQDTNGNYFLAFQSPGFPVSSAINSNIELACRAYPEADSPYSSLGVTRGPNGQFVFGSGNTRLENLNLCEDGADCQCSYKKALSAEQGDLYYSDTTTRSFPDDSRSISSLQGWHGYCVEFDNETLDPNGNPECLAWLPVDVPKAANSVFDNHPETGFTSSGPVYYCLNAAGNRLGGELGGDPVGGLSLVDIKNNNYFVEVEADDFSDKTIVGNSATGYALAPKSGVAHFTPRKINNGGSAPGILNILVSGKALDGASGLHAFDVKSSSPLNNLHEYDIEAIVLKVKKRQASDWPQVSEEFILNRDGFAKSPYDIPETNDRWTALWCGGTENAKCDFNGEYSWDKFLPFISDNGACHNGEDSISDNNDTNLFAVKAVFAGENDPDPYKFLGFEGGLCDNTKADGWAQFNVIFQLREWCSEVIQVHSNQEASKPWTARLEGKSVTSFPALYSAADNSFVGDLTYNIGQDREPFGSTVPPLATINNPSLWDSRKDIGTEFDRNGNEISVTLEPGRQPLYVERGRGQVRAGSPYHCGVTNNCVVPPEKNGTAPDTFIGGPVNEALDYIKQIFVKIAGIWQWDKSSASYALQSNTSQDFSAQIGRCPIVQSANNSTGAYLPIDDGSGGINPLHINTDYLTQSQPGNCASGRFSVFGREVAHTGSGGVAVGIQHTVFAGQEVPLEFYAYNKNGEQLPLKKIIIDWGDGNVTEVESNFKNHKPSLADYANAGVSVSLTGLACNNASANYGDTAEACQNGVFKFRHIYQQPGNYIPKLTVIDNWGIQTESNYSSANPTGDTVIKVLPLLKPSLSPDLVASDTEVFSNETVSLTWTNILDATYYEVHVDNNLAQSTTSLGYSLTGLVGEKDVKVRACNVVGCGPFSNELAINFIVPIPVQPTITTDPLAQNVSILSSANVVWGDVIYAEYYEAYVNSSLVRTIDATSPTAFTLLSSAPSLKNASVKACNTSGCSPFSNQISVNFVDPVNSVPVLSSAKSTYSVGENAVVNWQAVAHASRYEVYVNESPVNVSVASTNYNQLSNVSGRYNIKVRACNLVGCGAFSTILPINFTLSVPSSPSISSSPSSTSNLNLNQQVNISWASVNNAATYQIFDGSSQIDNISQTNYSINSSSSASKTINIRACNVSGCSSPSNSIAISWVAPSPPPAPPPPAPDETEDSIIFISPSPSDSSTFNVPFGQSLQNIVPAFVTNKPNSEVDFFLDRDREGERDKTLWITINDNTGILTGVNNANVTSGTYILGVGAAHAITGTSAPLRIITLNILPQSAPQDSQSPSISITSPSNGASVSGSTAINANASDNVGVIGVQFKLNGSNLGSEDTTAPYSISWNTTNVLNGSHAITAVARDASGNQTTSGSVNVTVSNNTGGGSSGVTPIEILSPSGNLGNISLGSSRTVSISANISWSSLSISGNGASMTTLNQNQGFITIAPNSNPHRGNKSLTITAVSADGNSSDSTSINWFVPN